MAYTSSGNYEDVRRAAAKAAVHTIINDGGTFNPRSGVPIVLDSGYVVGGIVDSVVVPFNGIGKSDHNAIEAIASFIQRMPVNGDIEYPHNLGTWVEDGELHIDAVEIVMDREVAISAGWARGEIAIWDVAKSESVYVKDEVPDSVGE